MRHSEFASDLEDLWREYLVWLSWILSQGKLGVIKTAELREEKDNPTFGGMMDWINGKWD